jgi:diphthine-ammonia ligase
VTRVFASWSGGKDGCLAVHRAVRDGMEVRYLANTVTADGHRSCSHGIGAAVIRRQAEAIGITIYQQPTGDNDYRERFLEMLAVFRDDGVSGGVFGDIDFEPHREWVEAVCAEAGMTAHLPLWQEDQRRLLDEFIDAGFVSVVVAVKKDLLGPEFLGRVIARDFLADVAALDRGITPCGEAGEFHSLVVDGPLFRQRLELTGTATVTRGDHHFLDIGGVELKAKGPV